MLFAFVIILLFLSLGEALRFISGVPIPGSIIGMLLLFIAQFIFRDLCHHLKPLADLFQRYLSLIYFPAGIGLILQYQLFANDGLPVLVATIIGTILAIIILALISRYIFPKENQSGES